MTSSFLSRSAVFLLFVLVVMVAVFILGRQYAGATFQRLGLDWWKVPEAYLYQNQQEQRIQRLTYFQEEMHTLSAVRNQILTEILDGKKSLNAGFAEFHNLCVESPAHRYTLDAFYLQDTLEQRIKAYFGKLLHTSSATCPEKLDRLRIDLQQLEIPIPNLGRSLEDVVLVTR